ncbi:MAG: hypothetical protein E6J42_06180 [Chloroflexi bacterium]|nr:MAG: hypothetical protein E6J42_06180 [Chloroflexota bacterium]
MELRRFGLTTAAALLILGLFLVWRRRGVGVILMVTAVVLALVAVGAPSNLGRVERIWMKMTDVLSTVATTIVLTLTFFVVITPVGLLVRLFSGNGMGLKIDRRRATYWEQVDADGPATRPDKPF